MLEKENTETELYLDYFQNEVCKKKKKKKK